MIGAAGIKATERADQCFYIVNNLKVKLITFSCLFFTRASPPVRSNNKTCTVRLGSPLTDVLSLIDIEKSENIFTLSDFKKWHKKSNSLVNVYTELLWLKIIYGCNVNQVV